MSPDFINASFEFLGGYVIFLSIFKLCKDRELKGVSIAHFSFFFLWGVWNLFYYPSLNQPLSFAGGAWLVVMQGGWLYWYLKIKYEQN